MNRQRSTLGDDSGVNEVPTKVPSHIDNQVERLRLERDAGAAL